MDCCGVTCTGANYYSGHILRTDESTDRAVVSHPNLFRRYTCTVLLWPHCFMDYVLYSKVLSCGLQRNRGALHTRYSRAHTGPPSFISACSLGGVCSNPVFAWRASRSPCGLRIRDRWTRLHDLTITADRLLPVLCSSGTCCSHCTAYPVPLHTCIPHSRLCSGSRE